MTSSLIFSKCLICDISISNHSDEMINECYDSLMSTVLKNSGDGVLEQT